MTISQTDGDGNDNDDRRLSLIDFSSADDSLISNPFPHQRSDSFFTPNSRYEFDDASTKLNEWERDPHTNVIQNNNKFNMRQSLAWDTAFFTSPGVLDAEELSSMIEGVKKGDKHKSSLPAIQEDVQGSCESISTFKSNNNLTQESLEDDLFQDVRASIQNFSRMSHVARTNGKSLTRFQIGSSSKDVGLTSSKKAPSSRSPSAGIQGTRKIPKKNPISPHLSQKPVTRREEPCISKQPKTIGKSSPSSTISPNRSSLGDLHVKSKKDKANKNSCGKVNSVMNTAYVKGSQVNGIKPIPSSKSPLGLSVATKTKSTVSPSSSSNLSRNISKSPLNSLKRKVDAGTQKSRSSCSIFRTPPIITSRDKIRSSNSSRSGLGSVTKFSSSISPASPTSDRSSVSSSTSMKTFRSNSSRTTFHSSSSRKHLPENDARHVSNSQKSRTGSCSEGKEIKDAGSVSKCAKATAAGLVLTPSPKKPLGLRQPSPKIGLFERVKSSVRSPRGGTQQQTRVPHGRASPSEGQNKAKLGKLQSPRSIISTKNQEFNKKQDLHPVPLGKSPDVKTSMVLPHAESSAVAPMEVQMPLKAGVGNLDANSTVAEGHISGAHDLNYGVTQENSDCDDQVDCLSRKVELMDINLKTQT